MHSEASVPRELPVMVGVDGSRSRLSTLDLAVAAAVRHRAPLEIVHVWPGRYAGSLRPRGPLPTKEDGRHLLEIAARRARHSAPGLRVGTRLVPGGAAVVLTGLSDEAGLLVIGHRDAVPSRSGWGSTAAYLSHHSACPLLVYRGAARERGPVVLAASGHRTGTATPAYAYQEAALRGARLVVAHVWAPPDAGGVPSPRSSGYRAGRAGAEGLLARLQAEMSGPYPDVAVDRLLVADAEVDYTVRRAAHRGRLLVAGIGRTGRLAELLYGSPVSPQAACPVLLVPPVPFRPLGVPRRRDESVPSAGRG
jgi:nucleotide-binding universal stress UspA family protein